MSGYLVYFLNHNVQQYCHNFAIKLNGRLQPLVRIFNEQEYKEDTLFDTIRGSAIIMLLFTKFTLKFTQYLALYNHDCK